MTILVSSDMMDDAESMVSLAVSGRGRKHKKPPMQFAVFRLAMLRDARMMRDLLHEYHSERKIHVINMEKLEQALALDDYLEALKDRLVGIFHPVPGADQEEMKTKLGFGEVEPAREFWSDEWLQGNPAPRWASGESGYALGPSARGRPRRSPSYIEEQAKESIRRGELEWRGLDNLKALADSLLDKDVKGVVPEDTIGEIHTSATTLINSLRRLQQVVIPNALSEINNTRNKEVVMPYQNL